MPVDGFCGKIAKNDFKRLSLRKVPIKKDWFFFIGKRATIESVSIRFSYDKRR